MGRYGTTAAAPSTPPEQLLVATYKTSQHSGMHFCRKGCVLVS